MTRNPYFLTTEKNYFPDIEHESATSFKAVYQVISNHTKNYDPKDVLILFDVDMVILRFHSQAFFSHTISKYAQSYKSLTSSIDHNTLIDLFIWHSITHEMELVDEEASLIIKNLQKDFQCLALTGMRTGPFGPVPKLEEWRYENLKKFDLSFDSSTNLPKTWVFSGVPVFNNHYPLYHHGILMTNGLPRKTIKAELMEHYFAWANYEPKVVILVDDMAHNLDALAHYLKQKHPQCDFLGIDFDPQYLLGEVTISEPEFRKTWEDHVDEYLGKI